MDYRLVCEALSQAGYDFQTFSQPAGAPSQRCAFDFPPPERPLCLLRHDVDHDTRPALEMGRIEASFGIRSTYFILTTDSAAAVFRNPASRRTALDHLRALADLGHEIGLHYDPLGDFFADGTPPRDSIEQALDHLRASGVPVSTCAAHGSGRLRQLTGGGDFPLHLANYRVWTEFGQPEEMVELNGRHLPLPCLSLADFGLKAEAYQTRKDHYLSDSGGYLWRVWDGQDQPFEQIKTAPALDLPAWLAVRAQPGAVTQALVHPVWWVGSLPLDRYLYEGVPRDLTHGHCMRVRQHETTGARLTVAIPMRRAARIGWLALESLARQQDPGVPWEVLVLEDESDPSPLGRDAVLAFNDRLAAAGCAALRHETLPDPLGGGQPAVSIKWKRLGSLASASSEVFLTHGADDFSAPDRLSRAWRLFQDPTVDATHDSQGIFLDLAATQPATAAYTATAEDPAQGLNLAFRTALVRDLPYVTKTSHTNAWLLAAAAKVSGSPLTCLDQSGQPGFSPSLFTQGFNSALPLLLAAMRAGSPPFQAGSTPLPFPPDILERLASLSPAASSHLAALAPDLVHTVEGLITLRDDHTGMIKRRDEKIEKLTAKIHILEDKITALKAALHPPPSARKWRWPFRHN